MSPVFMDNEDNANSSGSLSPDQSHSNTPGSVCLIIIIIIMIVIVNNNDNKWLISDNNCPIVFLTRTFFLKKSNLLIFSSQW